MNSTGSFVLGALVGAATALLVSPRSGPETREELRRVMGRGREQVGRTGATAQLRLTAMVSDVQEKTRELINAGGEVAEAKRQDLMEAIQVAKRALAEEREILMRSHRERRMAFEDAANEE